MKIVHWRSRITGFTGRGEPLREDMAEAVVADANEHWPELHHWIEDAR